MELLSSTLATATSDATASSHLAKSILNLLGNSRSVSRIAIASVGLDPLYPALLLCTLNTSGTSRSSSQHPGSLARIVSGRTAAMASADDDVTTPLMPESLPAWLGVGGSGAAWLTQSLALTHGQEYLARRLWLQQHISCSSKGLQPQRDVAGSSGDSGSVGIGGSGDEAESAASLQLHHDVVRLLEERISQGMHACVAAEAGGVVTERGEIMIGFERLCTVGGLIHCGSLKATRRSLFNTAEYWTTRFSIAAEYQTSKLDLCKTGTLPSDTYLDVSCSSTKCLLLSYSVNLGAAHLAAGYLLWRSRLIDIHYRSGII